jgi:hypothetical protein
MAQLFANNARSHLVSAAAAEDEALSVASAGSFPALAEEDYYLVTLVEKNENGREIAWEIARVVSVTDGVLTVERAQEDTPARDWPEGTPVELRLTAGTMKELAQSELDETLLALIYAGL